MDRIDELIEAEQRRHEGESYWSYNLTDLIVDDLLSHKEEVTKMTRKEIGKIYNKSSAWVTKYLQLAGLSCERTYRGVKITLPKKRPKKVPDEVRKLIHWVNTYNKGRLRHIYYDMLKRCHNPDNRGYASYGARGIAVCDEWRNNRLAFFQWAKDNGYEAGKTIDRIDNNKGYSPDNCRWTTWKVQTQNRRNTIWISWKGEKKTLKEWSEELGIDYSTLKDRIYRYHWSVEKAFTEKVQEH